MSEDYDTIENTFEVEDQPKLIVKNINGSIVIKSTDANTIHAIAKIDLRSGDPDRVSVNIFQDDDGAVHAETDYGVSSFWKLNRNVTVDYEITVPKNCTVSVNSVNSYILIADISGDIDLKAVNGKIEARAITGNINFKTVNGRMDIANLTGTAKLNTVAGKIIVIDSQIEKLSAKSVAGMVSIQTSLGEGPYKLNNVSGSLKLTIPENSPCTIRSNSISGRLRTNLATTHSSISSNSSHIEILGGGPKIMMNTVSGSMEICDNTNTPSQRPTVNPDALKEIRLGVLTELEKGQLSVEDALEKLS